MMEKSSFTKNSKINFLAIGSILVVSIFLRFYRLDELMMFPGDFAWFYLSAKDMIMTGSIPLSGITSSQTWLHQGPLWTYLLAIVLLFFNFNPLSGAYLSITLGVVTVFLMYKIGSWMFSKKIGLIAAALYATSPLVIIHSRMPYHTSPIPFFIILFVWCLYKWVGGSTKFFPLILMTLAILYNLELATVVLWFIVLFVLIFGLWQRKEWSRDIFSKKITLLSFLAFAIPMTPILIYDSQHEFVQTAKFAHWVIYHRILKFFFNFDFNSAGLSTIIYFLAEQYKRLIFLKSGVVALAIFLSSLILFARRLIKLVLTTESKANYIILSLCIFVPLASIIFNKTPSDAYMPILFPTVILLTALFFDSVLRSKQFFILGIILFTGLCLLNVYTLLLENYLMGKPNGYGAPYQKLLKETGEIIKLSRGREYNLVGGKRIQLESFEYLTWWLGHGPSKKDEKLKIYIRDNKEGIQVETK